MKKRVGQTVTHQAADVQLADTIRAVREDMELSQDAFSKRLGVSTTTVARWERAERTPEKWSLVPVLLLARGARRSYLEFKIGRTREEIVADFIGKSAVSYNKDAPLPEDLGPSPLTKQQRQNLREEAHHWIDEIFKTPAPDAVIRKVIECVREEGGKWTRAREAQKK